MYLFSTQSNKKSVNLGTLPVFLITKHLVIFCPVYLSGNMKEFIWKKSGKVKNLYGKSRQSWEGVLGGLLQDGMDTITNR
jgi:hypothetical protein